MALMDQPLSMNRLAKEVEELGMGGGSPLTPKSLGVETRPTPKCSCQIRLTITRAVNGLSGLAMAWARSRRPLPLVKGLASPLVETPGGTVEGSVCRVVRDFLGCRHEDWSDLANHSSPLPGLASRGE